MSLPTHRRALIRDAFVQRLLNTTPAGERVYPMRVSPFKDAELLPVMGVYTLNERVQEEVSTTIPRTWRMSLEVDVNVVIGMEPSKMVWGDELDELCQMIEHLIPGDLPELSFVDDIAYQSCQISAVPEAAVPVATANLTWVVSYYREETPVVRTEELNELKLIHYDFDLAPLDGQTDLQARTEFKP